MIPLSTTEVPGLKFTPNVTSVKVNANSAKIGWLHSKAKPGAKFDLAIKDGLGRLKFQKRDCGNDSAEYGELANLETRLGEELNVEVTNIRGSDEVTVFLN